MHIVTLVRYDETEVWHPACLQVILQVVNGYHFLQFLWVLLDVSEVRKPIMLGGVEYIAVRYSVTAGGVAGS